MKLCEVVINVMAKYILHTDQEDSMAQDSGVDGGLSIEKIVASLVRHIYWDNRMLNDIVTRRYLPTLAESLMSKTINLGPVYARAFGIDGDVCDFSVLDALREHDRNGALTYLELLKIVLSVDNVDAVRRVCFFMMEYGLLEHALPDVKTVIHTKSLLDLTKIFVCNCRLDTVIQDMYM